jgi:hypothetical protein
VSKERLGHVADPGRADQSKRPGQVEYEGTLREWSRGAGGSLLGARSGWAGVGGGAPAPQGPSASSVPATPSSFSLSSRARSRHGSPVNAAVHVCPFSPASPSRQYCLLVPRATCTYSTHVDVPSLALSLAVPRASRSRLPSFCEVGRGGGSRNAQPLRASCGHEGRARIVGRRWETFFVTLGARRA